MKRINFIDVIKGIAIILVVLGHSFTKETKLLIWIYSFHMPLFFITSGMTYQILGRTPTITISKAKKYIIPYLFWNFTYLTFLSLLAIKGGASTFETIHKNAMFFISLGGSPMWFLPVMLVSNTFFSAYHRMRINHILIPVGLALIFTIGFDTNKFTAFFIRSIIGFCFIEIGYSLPKLYNQTCRWYILPILFIASLPLVFMNGKVDISTMTFNNNFLYLLNAIIGSFIITQLSRKYIPSKIKHYLIFCGKNSLKILCLHQFVIELIRLIEHMLLGTKLLQYCYLDGFVVASITLLFVSIAMPLISRILWFTFSDKKPTAP